MTIQVPSSEKTTPSSISAKDAIDFLQQNDDFFVENPQLLTDLAVPHPNGGVVSLIERQVALLRVENKDLRNKIKELVEIAKENDQLMLRLHQVSTELVKAKNIDEYLAIINERLLVDFNAHAVVIKLIGEFNASRPDVLVQRDAASLKPFDSILKQGNPICGRFNKQQLESLFVEKVEEIKSVAFVPIMNGDQAMGFFAVASNDQNRFKVGISTVFLSQLAEIASASLQRFFNES